MIGAGNEKQFKKLVENILHMPELLTDPRFANNNARVENRDALVKIITDVLLQNTRNYWLSKFEGLGVPFGPINNIAETFAHPQARAREIVVEVEHPRAGKIKLVAPAVSYNGRRMPITRPPPWLSQHTTEVLTELGYSSEEISELRSNRVI